MESIDVSIIIVNYNTFKTTANCIESIYSTRPEKSFEIIVVDNNSSECNPELFKANYPEIILVSNTENLGFGRANNLGMSVAGGKYFLLLNSDTLLINNVIDIAYQFAENNKETDHVFGADIRNSDMTVQRSFYYYNPITLSNTFHSAFIMENPLLARLIKLKQTPKKNTRSKIGGLYGAYIFLHRDVYEKTGGFDPDFFMYCEDTEWFRNRINKKYNVAICFDAQVIHIGGKSSDYKSASKLNILSYYLYWYKLGVIHFIIYIIGSFFSSVFVAASLPFMSKAEKKRNMNQLKFRFQILPKVFFDIPRYKNTFKARPNSLNI